MKPLKSTLALASAVVLSTASSVTATPTLYIDFGDDGTIDATFIDGTLSDVFVGVSGLVGGVGIGGGFMTSVTGSTKPALGTATQPELAETTLNISGTGTVAVYFSEVGFGPTAQGYLAELSITSLAASATVDYYSYADATNTEPLVAFSGAGSPMTSLSLVSLGATSGSGTLPFDGSSSFPFALTQKVVITQPSGGSTSLTANLSVPDGGTTVSLLGVSLLGLGFGRRILRRKA